MAEENKLFYKFRNLESVFEYKELENQEIYFALPEELNDPMDCQPNIVFKGDSIVWLNFLRYLLVNITSDFMLIDCINNPIIPFSEQYFDINARISLQHNKYLSKLYDDVYSNIENDLENISNILAQFDKPISKDVMTIILFKIMNLYISVLNKNAHKNEIQNDKYKQYINDIEETINIFKNVNIDVANYQKIKRSFNDILLYYNTKNNEYKKHFIFDFFINYINRFNEFLFPHIRIASFSTVHSNTLMWSHYADDHKGICLIFDIPIIDNSYQLNLFFNNKIQATIHTLLPVKYTEDKADINLFTNNYLTAFEEINNAWYYHPNNNNKSKYSTNYSLYDPNTILKLGKTFSESYFVKSKVWEYEEEYRMWTMNKNSNKQNIRYDFSSLNGIIFGIKTPLKDKLKIIDIIKEKCKKENRENFNFYQAYYNADKNKIDTYLIDDKLFMEHM